MPRFLLKTENHISILVVFFVLIIVVLPGSVLFWITTSKRFDKNGVLQDNTGLYLRVLNENLNIELPNEELINWDLTDLVQPVKFLINIKINQITHNCLN